MRLSWALGVVAAALASGESHLERPREDISGELPAVRQLRSAMCLAGPLKQIPSRDTLERTNGAAASLRSDVLVVVLQGQYKVPQELAAALQPFQKLGWPVVLMKDSQSTLAFQAALSIRFQLDNRSSASERLRSYILPPDVRGVKLPFGPGRRQAFQSRMLWLCREAMLQKEEARSQLYSHWIFQQIDFHWIVPPPSLRSFHKVSPSSVWIPEGSDFDGVNDRLAIVPRAWADAYFGLWRHLWLNASLDDQILDQSLITYMSNHPSKDSPTKPIGHAFLLLASLNWHNASIARFSSVAALICTQASHQAVSQGCRLQKYVAYPPLSLRFQSYAEAQEAHLNAELQFQGGWQWQAVNETPYRRPCFKSLHDQEQCCSLRGPAGPADLSSMSQCWNDLVSWDYSRCCTQTKRLILLPTKSLASKVLNPLLGPSGKLCLNM
ncbi:unnamed protein product [Polarella glacialis]|uniref:Protein xylosyltransferase n=1 Tax=Polarella glacialis TaxID=89957 RepID=A0A813E049_POLGL|nr:unnamed protein product [Polarella glacialis]